MPKTVDLLADWIERIGDRVFMTNEWLNGSDMNLYVRKSVPRNLDGVRKAVCLDLASFEAYKKGRGTFTELLQRAHEMNPWEATYIECVHNVRLRGFLERCGMHLQAGSGETPCYYLFKEEKLTIPRKEILVS